MFLSERKSPLWYALRPSDSPMLRQCRHKRYDEITDITKEVVWLKQ